MKVHVVLVADQVLHNLIPVLMERPQRVFRVVFDEMARRCRRSAACATCCAGPAPR